VTMDNPDVKGREDILKVHSRGKPLAPDVDTKAIAKITSGFSGADLENLVNEAAILAARRNRKNISMSEMQESMERVVMGPERRSRVISPEQKRKTAYHEAGHALVTHFLDEADPVHKMTIVSRGPALGFMMPLPQEDKYALSSSEIEAKICVMMGGRAAESIIFGQFYTGAMQDLQQATRLARAMVTQFGMSEKLGPRAYGSSGQPVFMGRSMGENRDYSEEFAREIDEAVNNILLAGYERAKELLMQHRDKMETLVDVLMERETLDSTEFQEIMSGEYGGIAFDGE
jgi:cell division protease FtsH